MATVWTLKCTSSGMETTIMIEDAVLGDTWTAVSPEDWDVPRGRVGNLGQPTLFLFNGTSTPHQLVDFRRSTEPQDTGTGTKSAIDGNFPGGDFNWICTAKE
jgi:hypothetical protein